METRIQLIEDNFESQQSGKSDLLIHIDTDTLSYAIVDKGNEQVKALVDYKSGIADLDAIMQTDRYLNYYYRRIKITTPSSKFTFIPREIYAAEEINEYAKFISPVSAADVLVNDIRPFKIKNVMAMDAGFRQNVGTHFKQPVLYSQATPFIEGSYKTSPEPGLYGLNINMLQGKMEVALVKDETLLFYNLFESSTADEFNYFLLMVIRQFNLDPANAGVILGGRIENNDPYYQRIEKYFDHIRFADPRTFVKCSETFDNVNLHTYFSLLSLNLCE